MTPWSCHTWSAKVELDEKLGNGPSTAGLPASANPKRDLRLSLVFPISHAVS